MLGTNVATVPAKDIHQGMRIYPAGAPLRCHAMTGGVYTAFIKE
jgi:hypothetical protein